MGDNVRDCKRISETTESSSTSFAKKPRICLDSEELQVPLSNFELRNDGAVVDSSEKLSNSGVAVDGDPCSSFCSLFCQWSRCSSNEIVEGCTRCVDRETVSFETGESTSRLSREAIPSSDFCPDTNEMDSPVAEKREPVVPATPAKPLVPARPTKPVVPARPTKPVAPAKNVEARMPPQEEIEAFFFGMSMAEKLEQKRFIEKYNFDVVNDVPLEGRYQWVRLE